MRPVVVLDTNILLDILVFDDQRAHPLRSALSEKKIDAVYKAFAVERDGFKSAFEGVRALKIAGGAISMPFKKRAFHWVDEVQGIAAKIGTINTFRRETSGKLLGWNTDYLAALKAIPLGCGKVYLLGAGGVAAAGRAGRLSGD